MAKGSVELTGKRFGSLLVLKKCAEFREGYSAWLCRCTCGRNTIVSTRNLTGGRTTHCGCVNPDMRAPLPATQDKKGRRYGALTALGPAGKTERGTLLWECECACGNRVTVAAMQLQKRLVKDCGCGRGYGKKVHYRNIAGEKKGKLTAMFPTSRRDKRGSVIWRCRCDCGREVDKTESDFIFSTTISCGCVRQQRLEAFVPSEGLTFVGGTCVEWLEKRKSRSDNSSGFRGVTKCDGSRYRVYIGLQGKKYDLGRYTSFDEAVSVRLSVEKHLHDGFLSCWDMWQKKADNDRQWATVNPFFFDVEKDQRTFRISSTVTKQMIFQY